MRLTRICLPQQGSAASKTLNDGVFFEPKLRGVFDGVGVLSRKPLLSC